MSVQQQILEQLNELATRADQEDKDRRRLCQQVHTIGPLIDLIEKISRSPRLKDQAQKVRQSLNA